MTEERSSEETATPAAPAIDSREGRAARFVTAGLLVPALLAALVLVQTFLFRRSTCETYDEFTYLRLGIRIYRYNDFASLASPMCPPLPILLEYWLPSLRAEAMPDTEGWEMQVPGLIRQGRMLTAVTIGVPLVWVIYAKLARRREWLVGALGGGLAALSPSLLAASSIATTDACFVLFALIALAAIHRWQLRPTRGRLALAGAAIGLAIASKQTGLFLFPVMLAELLIWTFARRGGFTSADAFVRSIADAAWRLVVLVALAFVVDWSLYEFAVGAPFSSMINHAFIPVFVPMIANQFPGGDAFLERVGQLRPPLAIDTFVGQLEHATTGHAAFLMGRYSATGWWYFFPVAIAIKSTPAELLAFALAALQATRRRTWLDPARRLWLVSLGVLLGMGMASKLNIGHRYMLLLYPLAVLLAADTLGQFALRRPGRAALAGGVLLAWQAVSAVGIAPHYLSYFNSTIGGPYQGYRYLVDSSLDWGQDLPALRRELEARGYRKVALNYFGTASPRAYGLRSTGFSPWDQNREMAECDWLAISATRLQGVYGGSSELRRRFEALPSIRVGYTIFLYDLKDPKVRAVVDAYLRAEDPSRLEAPPH
jgi:hypothetical protein